MAEYRLSATPISRGKGQSAIACAAYRSGTKLHCERYGITQDYTLRSGVRHEQILAPDNAPEWMRDRQQLWNAVEKVERKANSQLSREIQLNLPHELTHEQRHELVMRFVQDTFVADGMIADVAIHDPHKTRKGSNEIIPVEERKNYHAHVMLTMRELTGDGFHAKKSTPKARSWNHKDSLLSWREAFEVETNKDLERHGHEARVSCKSYKERGIKKIPQIHLGHKSIAAQNKYEQGKLPNPDPRYLRNAQIISFNKTREERIQRAQEYLNRKKQLADIARERTELFKEIGIVKREAAQLQQSIKKAGLLGFWQTLTGQRQAELMRIEDLKAEYSRIQAEDRATKLAQEKQRQAQAALLKKRTDEKTIIAKQQEAANDNSGTRSRPTPLSENRPRPQTNATGRPRPQQHERPRPGQKRSRDVDRDR